MNKKWMILALALGLVLTGCGKKKAEETQPQFQDPIPMLTEAPTWPTAAPEETLSDGVVGMLGPVDESTPEAAETEEATAPEETEAPAETAPKPDSEVEEVDETVYAKAQVNVRKGPGFSHAVIGKLHGGDSVKRTGIGKHGWSRITYEGQTAYVANNYVTTDSPEKAGGATFKEVNQTVKATAKVNVRKGPGVDYDIVGQLQAGEEVSRSAVGNKGWSRIKFKDGTAYVANNYLKVVTNSAVPEETKAETKG